MSPSRRTVLNGISSESALSLLTKQGAHPTNIASRLGHTSVKTVVDIYGHLLGVP